MHDKFHLQNNKIIAFIGSLCSPSHPVHLLLEEYRYVCDKLSNTTLLIVGAGDEKEKLQTMCTALGIEKTTIFTGFINPAGISLYYHLADVVIDPVNDDSSARGHLPLKMFEALITGTPFARSDVGDRKLLLGEPQAGILVQPGIPRVWPRVS